MKKKEVPDDVVLVMCSIFFAIVWLWTQQGGIKSLWDFQIYFIAFVCMVSIPMLYSGYVHYKHSKK